MTIEATVSDSTTTQAADPSAAPPAEAPTTDTQEAAPVESTPRESAIARSIREKNAKLVQRQQAFAREREEHTAAIKREREELAAWRAEREAIRKDPVGYFERQEGLSRREIAERLLRDDGPAPEDGVKDALKSVADLRAEIVKEREELAKAKAQAEQHAVRVAAEREFLAKVETNAAKYPIINAVYSKEELLRETYAVLQEAHRKTGHAYSDEEALEFIEARELKRAEKYRNLSLDRGTSPPPKLDESKSAPKNSGASRAPSLTNRAASERATLSKDPLKMSAEEELTEIRRQRDLIIASNRS